MVMDRRATSSVLENPTSDNSTFTRGQHSTSHSMLVSSSTNSVKENAIEFRVLVRTKTFNIEELEQLAVDLEDIGL
ncbi:hypothetical protein ACFX12_026747 [Malus domestica]